MEDAAGVVRRIILLWCEVIIPPCPPSLSCSQVYFWLAAPCIPVCVRVCVCALLSVCLEICKTLNIGKNSWHPFVIVKTLISGQRKTRYACVQNEFCGYTGGVMFVSLIMFLLSKLKYIQSEKLPPPPPPPPHFPWSSLRHPNESEDSLTRGEATQQHNIPSGCNTMKPNRTMIWRGSTFTQNPAGWDKVCFLSGKIRERKQTYYRARNSISIAPFHEFNNSFIHGLCFLCLLEHLPHTYITALIKIGDRIGNTLWMGHCDAD